MSHRDRGRALVCCASSPPGVNGPGGAVARWRAVPAVAREACRLSLPAPDDVRDLRRLSP